MCACSRTRASSTGFANLALPFFGFSEPIEAPSREYRGEKWNLWSRLDVKVVLSLIPVVLCAHQGCDFALFALNGGLRLCSVEEQQALPLWPCRAHRAARHDKTVVERI